MRRWSAIRDAAEEVAGLVLTESEARRIEDMLASAPPSDDNADCQLLKWVLSECVEILGICGVCKTRPNTKSFTYPTESEDADPVAWVFGACCDDCLPAVEAERGLGFTSRDLARAPLLRKLIDRLGWSSFEDFQ